MLNIVTYLPVYLAGLVTIPVVLIGRLYGSTLAGFAAACLATAGSSFFNRTMAGYLDTDIFSVTIPVFILYFLLRAHRESSVPWMVAGSVSVMCYPFFYSPSPNRYRDGPYLTGLRAHGIKAWWKSKGLEKMLPHPANLDLIQPLFRQPVGGGCCSALIPLAAISETRRPSSSAA